MAIGAAVFAGICVLAVVGYMSAGWKLSDAVYMVVITIFGIGYGEVQPVDSIKLRALTMSLIIFGNGSAIYIIGGFMQMLIDGELRKALGARRMTQEIEQLQDHTIICGVGRMGTILARELKAEGKPFVVLDIDEKRLQAAAERGYLVVNGDAAEEVALEQAGIRRAAVLATVLPNDAANVFVTITAREMNPKIMIIARAENPRTEKKLLGCGASQVVLPMAIGAKKLAQLIIRPSAENMLAQLTHQSDMHEDLGRIGLQFDELEVAGDSALANRALSELELRSNHGFLIVGVRHADGSTLMSPPPTTKLAVGDVVIVIGRDGDIPQLAAKFSSKPQLTTYRGAKL
ncbi:MAG: potassium channel protein [Planctomycetes bacterium]|nr:potassium channel protein [Planctomycetota bacterium]